MSLEIDNPELTLSRQFEKVNAICEKHDRNASHLISILQEIKPITDIFPKKY